MDVLYEPRHIALKARETLRGYVRRFGEAVRSIPADVNFVYREAALLGPAWIERLLAIRRPLIFDFYLVDTSP